MPDRTVRVGIVTWNCAEDLQACLEALPAALGELVAEVVVFDNASSDESAAVAAATPGVRSRGSEDNLGYARGMNEALAGPAVDVLIALNPDTVPAPGSLATLVDELERHPGTAVVGPLLRERDGSIEHSVHRFPTVGIAALVAFVPRRWISTRVRDRLWLAGAVRPGRRGPVDWVTGAVHVMRAAATGPRPYDERWFMYVEDVALCHRLGRQGWRTRFVGDVEVLHVGNVSGEQAFGDARETRWMGETYDWYEQVHGALAVRAYAAVNAVGVLLRLVRVLARGRRRRGVRTAAGRWWRLLCLHARVAVAGPPAPGPPGVASG